MSGQPDEIMAFVKFEHQVFVVSLNPYDGYDQWIKVLSGLAPCPVEVVLMGDKSTATSERSQGIAITNRQSFLEAMKVVQKAREQSEVIRMVLHPLPAASQNAIAPSSVRQHTPLMRLCQNSPKKSNVGEEGCESPQKPARAFRVVNTSDCTNQQLESYLRKDTDNIQNETAPRWANEMKKDMQDLIDSRFQDLHKNMEEKLAQLGSQMKESMMLSYAGASAVPSLVSSFSPASSFVVPQASGSEQIFSPRESCRGSQSSKMADWVVPPPASLTGSVEMVEKAHAVEEFSDDAESVVLVSQPESSNIELDDLDAGDGHTVGGQSDSVELVSAEQIQQHADDLISDSGSVVYVETDGEDDEEDAFSNLRSWAADGNALSNSHTTYAKMADSYSESLQSSFHSTKSGRDEAVAAPLAQETIVYKMYPAVDVTTPIPASDSVDNHHEVEEVFVAAQEEIPRPLPINGSAQLPTNINAMRPVEEQNLFSPNSDIGTILLSAASSIANGFLQSMESFSKTLADYENRRLSQQHSTTGSVAPSEASRPDLEMETVASDVEVSAPQVTAEVESAVAPEAPPRSRGPRGPPPSVGPYMTWEQMSWYFNEYGVPDLIKAPWVNDRLTLQEFEAQIVQHFDRLE